MTQTYDASSITVLEGLEAVRKRPGMYIGTTGSKGLHHLVWEILDNCIDEHLAGYGKVIKLTINEDNSITIEDEARGVPVDIHAKGIPTLRVIYTVLHAGGKFGGGSYKNSGGLHGVGASVVNALSEYVEVEVRRNGKVYIDRYENGGHPVTELTSKNELPVIGESTKTGTKVTFLPDSTIFETTKWDVSIIQDRLQEMAYLNRGLKFEFTDKRTGETAIFHEKDGILGYLEHVNEDKEIVTKPFYIHGISKDIEVEFVFQHTKEYGDTIFSYCNNISTVNGGTHVTGLRSGITRLINSYVKELNKAKSSLDGRDIRSGLVAILSIKHFDPQYEGQTKEKLSSTDAKMAVEDVVMSSGHKVLDLRIQDVEDIIEHALKAQGQRSAEEKSRLNLQSKEAKLQTNGKLVSCNSRNPEECEIFFVEGDSAGGTAKQGRDRKFQAILPLKGKVINVEKKSLTTVLSNEEIATIITAIGTGIGDDFDIKKARYKKIVILTDADVDGSHIRTLLLTFFYRYMRPLMEEGYIYKGCPPLYKVTYGKGKKEKIIYAYNDKELQEILKENGKATGIQRYKGLGEMNADQLWETTLDPKTRKLSPIKIDSLYEADKITQTLMGSKVEDRRKFLEKHAKEANI